MGIKKEKRQNGAENLFKEIIPKNFQNMKKELDIHICRAL